MGVRFLTLALLALVLLLSGCGSGSDLVRVERVIDGDTIIVDGGWRVRYIGIDAPELHPEAEYYGTEAWQANRELVEGRRVRLEKDVSDKDRYGRLLRYVYVDGVLVNAEMLKGGYAHACSYPPDLKYQESFEELERQARETGRGLWAR
jgi:micrococcal nuclease